jgi:hypothetical protein
MITHQVTSAIIGLLIAGAILFLVRRDHLHGPYALWWLAVSLAVVVLGLFPGLVDRTAQALGVAYPPVLLIVLGIGMILIKILTMDIQRSRQEIRLRRLAQRLAMLEGELRGGAQPADTDTASDPDVPGHRPD